MKELIWATIGAVALSGSAMADEFFTIETNESFENVALDVEDAITNRGLVIDSVSHVGPMLARTADDLGADTELFADARIYSFCSAVLSRESMETDLRNLRFCPYNIYVYQAAGDDMPVIVGYREADVPAMRNVNGLLQQIVASATGTN